MLQPCESCAFFFFLNRKPKIPLSNAEWPKYTAENPQFVYLQPNNYTKGRGPKKDRCEYWRPFLLKQREGREGGADEEPSHKAISASTESSVPTKQNKATAMRGTLHGFDAPSHQSSSSYTPEPTTVLFTFLSFIIWLCLG
ncbi:hypothetical protein HPB48_012680 [Haemaphysalis longicornis]|uniref:Uncharacterized protein n=1 Tax=Haemaphysalis longicornis TaxID=44386 RepID=A0A9J6FQB8_HAELO|nr:hypothetical protein HPB48_012680 [Haemaphysalis longicornis]